MINVERGNAVTSGKQNQKTDIDQAQAKKIGIQYHRTGLNMETPRQERKRKRLVTGPLGRHRDEGPYLEPGRSNGTGQRTLKVFWWHRAPQSGDETN